MLGGFLGEIDELRDEETHRNEEGDDAGDGAEPIRSGGARRGRSGGAVQRPPKRILAITHSAMTPSCQEIFLPCSRLRAL